MICQNCGRPMGKKNYCTYCRRKKKATRAAKRASARRYLPWLIAALCVIAVGVTAALLLTRDGGKHHVEIEIRDFGTVTVELDADAAPLTVENFLKLANEGFYNGLTFHRIQQGFMMQGGDPNGNGTGGSAETVKGEFSANGVENPLSHTRGAISMARSSDYDSASSQFFICDADATFLDGDYACFGYVTDGMDVVDAVCEYANGVARNSSSTITDAADQPVIEEVRVID